MEYGGGGLKGQNYKRKVLCVISKSDECTVPSWNGITSMNWNFQRGRGSTTLGFQCAKINRIQKLTFLPLPSFCLVLLLSTTKEHVYNFKRKSNKRLVWQGLHMFITLLSLFFVFFFTITPSEMYHLTETMPVSKKSISLLRALYESNYTFYGTVSD